MQQQIGANEFYDFKEAIHSTPPTSIHLNPWKGSRLKKIKDRLKRVPWSGNGYYLPERPVFTIDPGFQSGGYYVQEASSMSIEQAFLRCAGSFAQPKVLDLCASPGGKSTLLLSLLDSTGLLVSNEIIRNRIDPLVHNLVKWGCPNQLITCSDPERFTSLEGFFDIILVDAPCSGEGLFRKDIQSRAEWNESNVRECVLRQKRILKDAVHALAPRGFLIYSTCTYNPLENIDQVAYLKTYGLHSVPVDILEQTGFRVQKEQDCIGYQAYPHLVKGEGFFISLLQKDDSIHRESSARSASLDWVNIPGEVNQVTDTSRQSVFKYHDAYYLFPSLFKDAIEQMSKTLQIVQAGTPLGIFKHKDFIPHHALSQSIRLLPDVPSIALDSTDTLEYLKRSALNNISDNKGYHVVRFDDQVLGWVKAIQGRLNNLYPVQYRIRGNF